ncbi:hypothetical protein ACEPAG_9046 [Sanghuangporus baumii]
MATPTTPYSAERPLSAHSASSTSTIEKAGGDLKKSQDGSTDDLLPPVTESAGFSDILFPWRRRRKEEGHDLDACATRRSVFDDPLLAKHYWPTPKRSPLSGRLTGVSRSGPVSASPRNLDRNNLTNANSDNILGDLRMTTNDYNLGNTIFRCAFLAAELPSQMVSKRVGPDRWIPTQMVAWSIVTMFQFFLTSRWNFLFCRALLGFIQGGFIPDLILYLSYYYTKTELPIRLAFFWMSMNACNVVGSFLAYGILHMRGIDDRAGWRWLFLLEGLITFVIAVATFFMMPPAPTKTRTWFRPNGWFSEREETIIVSRILRDDPTKGDMHNREGLTLKRLWTAVLDYDLWPLYILGLMFGIPVGPVTQYLTLSLRELGFSVFETNLLTIPSTAVAIVTMLLVSLLSENIHDRALVSMLEDIWSLPFLVALYCLPANPSPWLYYGLASGLLCYPYVHPIQVGWCSRNSGAVASRTVNASLYNMFVQASSVIYSNIYRADDAPRYRRGNRVLIAISCVNIGILYPSAKLYYIWRNKQRDKVWNAMTPEQQAEYLATTNDKGNRRLDFRFSH